MLNFDGDFGYHGVLMEILAILKVCMGTLEIFPRDELAAALGFELAQGQYY